MSDYTPNTESVREGLVALARSDAARHGDVDLDVVASEVAGQFDRWLAEVERAAAEKAWDRCVGEMPIDPDWKNFYGDNNPYRAEAYRQEMGGRLK